MTGIAVTMRRRNGSMVETGTKLRSGRRCEKYRRRSQSFDVSDLVPRDREISWRKPSRGHHSLVRLNLNLRVTPYPPPTPSSATDGAASTTGQTARTTAELHHGIE
jgi:hypothetical protein